MSTTSKVICIINALMTIASVLYMFTFGATILAFLASGLGILVILLLFLTPIIWGAIIAIKHLFKKDSHLTTFEKLLTFFPLFNLFSILTIVLLLFLNN